MGSSICKEEIGSYLHKREFILSVRWLELEPSERLKKSCQTTFYHAVTTTT